MMQVIQQALVMGYTAAQVLGFIGSKIPHMNQGISNAKNRGYKDEDILKFLQGKIKVDNGAADQKSSQMNSYLSNIGRKTKQEKSNQKGRFLKGALGIGATALTAYGAYKNYSGLINQGIQALTGGSSPPNNPIQPQPAQPNPGANLGVATPGQGIRGSNPNAPLPNQPILSPPNQPTGGQNVAANSLSPSSGNSPPSPIDSSALLQQLGIKEKVDNLLNNNPPEIVSQAALSFNPAIKKMMEKGEMPPIQDIINDYASKLQTQQPQPEQNLPPEGAEVTQPIIQEKPQEIPKEYEPIPLKDPKIGDNVVTPEGNFGEIKHIGPKDVVVNIDGKLKKYDIDELEQEPAFMQELVNHILKIQEEDRSSNVALVGYSPRTNTLSVQHHNGEMFEYYGVPDDIAKNIQEKNAVPITEGQTEFGEFGAQDERSLGAALSKFIYKDPRWKKSKKGEKPNPNYQRVDTLYDRYTALRKKSKKPKS